MICVVIASEAISYSLLETTYEIVSPLPLNDSFVRFAEISYWFSIYSRGKIYSRENDLPRLRKGVALQGSGPVFPFPLEGGEKLELSVHFLYRPLTTYRLRTCFR